jgi:hypothetical protein
MKLRYLIVVGYHREEIDVEDHLVLMEWIQRLVERFGPLDLVYRM